MQHNRFAELLLRNRKKIITLLLVNMFTLWLLTISTMQIDKFPPDPFYYIKQLPIYYWCGMILAGITFIFLLYNPKSNPKKNELIQNISFIIILILYLFGLSSFIYIAPRYLDTYIFSNEIINMVIEAGSTHIDRSSYRGYMYLTEFQGSTLLFSMLIQSIGLNASLFSKYYILYSMFMISILIYIISRKVAKKYCLFAPITYLSLAWTTGYHFSPQSHAIMLSICLLYLLIILMIDKNNYITKKLLIMIVWLAICTSHAVSPLLNLISLFSLLFFNILLEYSSLFKKNLSERISTEIKSLSNLLILFATTYIAYILYESNFILARIISTIKETIINMLYRETFVVVDRAITTPTQPYTFCYNIRMSIIIGTMIFGILSIFYLFFNSKDRSLSFIISSLFLGYSFLGMYLVISGYNVYGSDRSFIFLLVPFSILCSMVLHTELKLNCMRYKIITPKVFIIFKILLVLFVITAMFLLPITRYAGEPYAFISESEYAGSEFILQHPSLPYSTFYTSLTFTNLRYNWYELKNQKGDEYENSFNSSNLNRIYDSGQCKIHKKRGM